MITIKRVLTPLLSASAAIWNGLSNAAQPRFQIVILHHIPRHQLPALQALLDLIEHENGFLTAEDAAARLATPMQVEARGRLPCLLTFDDGFNSAIPIVREILPRYDAKAVFFICPGLVDLPAEQQDRAVVANIFRGIAPSGEIPKLMTWAEIDEVRRAGHTIGAHGEMHLRLSDIPADQADREIIRAGSVLTERLGGDAPNWYAYAFGDIASISAPPLKTIRSHYRYCRSGIRGSNGADNIPGVMTAQEIDLDAPAHVQRAILKGALDLRYIGPRKRLRAYARNAAE